MIKKLLAVCFFLLCKAVFASSIGVMNGGLVAGGGADDTGIRERVELTAVGGLLIGHPRHSEIELITVYAPGIEKSHLILREIQQASDKKSLLFTAPDFLTDKIHRATIYLRQPAGNLVFFETVKGEWLQRIPQPFLSVTNNNENTVSDNELLAVSVSGFGPFWLLENDSPVNSLPVIEENSQTARSLLGGSMERALLPIVAAVLFLMLGWMASLWVHRLDRHADR